MGEYDDCMAAQRSVYNLKYYGGPFKEDNILFTMITGWGTRITAISAAFSTACSCFSGAKTPERGAGEESAGS